MRVRVSIAAVLLLGLMLGLYFGLRKPAREAEPPEDEELAALPEDEGDEPLDPEEVEAAELDDKREPDPPAPAPSVVADAAEPVRPAADPRPLPPPVEPLTADAGGPTEQEIERETKKSQHRDRLRSIDEMLTSARNSLHDLEVNGHPTADVQQLLNFGRRYIAELERERDEEQRQLRELERAR